MAQELGAISGIRSMLSARTSIERVVTKDVGALLPGRQLAKIDRSLASASRDAAAGAAAVSGVSDDAFDRLQHAVALLEDGRARATSRATWNGDRTNIALAYDTVQDALVSTRATLAAERAPLAAEVTSISQSWVKGRTLPAASWSRLAELAELPIGMRPIALEHVTPTDIRLLREQATRMTEGLRSSTDPRLSRILAGARIVTEQSTRESTEQNLRQLSTAALDIVNTQGDLGKLAAHLDDIGALQQLDPILRPRMLARSEGIDWTDAAALMRSGGKVPSSWEGFEHLRRITHLEHPQVALESLLQQRPERYTATQWRTLAALVRLAPEERPAALAGLGRRQAREMDTVAGMLDKHQSIPSSWNGVSKLNALRATALWNSKSTATDHLSSIIRTPPDRVTSGELSDLDALRQLPTGIRPDALDPSDARWAEAAINGDLTAAKNGAAFEAFVRLGVQLKTPDELRATLDRIDTHIAQLDEVQKAYTDQRPREVLRSFDADLRLLRAFDHEPVVATMIDETQGLLRHNIARLDGRVGGGYGRHADYAELGRVKENVRLFTELTRQKVFGESNTMARVRVARETAGAPPAQAATSTQTPTETLSW